MLCFILGPTCSIHRNPTTTEQRHTIVPFWPAEDTHADAVGYFDADANSSGYGIDIGFRRNLCVTDLAYLKRLGLAFSDIQCPEGSISFCLGSFRGFSVVVASH